MDVSKYLLFAQGLSALLKLVRGMIFGPIIMGPSGEGLAR